MLTMEGLRNSSHFFVELGIIVVGKSCIFRLNNEIFKLDNFSNVEK